MSEQPQNPKPIEENEHVELLEAYATPDVTTPAELTSSLGDTAINKLPAEDKVASQTYPSQEQIEKDHVAAKITSHYYDSADYGITQANQKIKALEQKNYLLPQEKEKLSSLKSDRDLTQRRANNAMSDRFRETKEEAELRTMARQPDSYERDADKAEFEAKVEKDTRQMIANIENDPTLKPELKQQILEVMRKNAIELVDKAAEAYDAIQNNIQERLSGEDNLLGKVLHAVEHATHHTPIGVYLGGEPGAKEFPYGPEAYEEATFDTRDILLHSMGLSDSYYAIQNIDENEKTQERTERGVYEKDHPDVIAKVEQAVVTDMRTGRLVHVGWRISPPR